MQRLWIITELFPPDETSTAYILGEIANAFSEKYEVHVICGPKIYDARKKLDPNNTFRLKEGIEVAHCEAPSLDKNTFFGKALRFILVSRRIHKAAKGLIQSGDKVLMVTNPAPLVLLMGTLRKRRDFELNILVHDVFPENTIPAGLHLPAIVYGLLKRFFDKAYARADRLIALGRDMKEVLSGKINSSEKVSIIENWADLDIINPTEPPQGSLILEYAGNIGRVQGLDKVVDALPDDVEFHLYGTGAAEESLKKKGRSNVFFHGAYFRSEQSKVLAACNIALVTLEDGMYGLGVPSKTYNILASGRPVLFIGPKNSEIDLLVRENKVGYCGWPDKWDREELQEMGIRARKLAEEKYSKQLILKKFTDLI